MKESMTRLLTKLTLLSLLFFGGCAKVDVCSLEEFCSVQSEVQCRTSETIYWNSESSDSIGCLEAENLLNCDLTEDLVVEIAILNNPKLQALYESLGIAKANVLQAGLLKNPIFSFAYRFPTKSNAFALIDAALFQNLLEILLIPLKKNVACEEFESTRALVIGRVLGTIAETKMAFYSFLAAQELWSLKKQMLLSAELSYEAAQHLYNAGNLPEVEVAIEKSTREQMKLVVASAEMEVLDAREMLNLVMGLYGRQINWTTSSTLPSVPDSSPSYDNIENDAVAESLDLKMAYHDLLATAARYGIKTSKLVLPQLDLGVSSEREEGIWYVGPAFNLAIPLFDWGQVNSAKARSTIMQKWNQFNALAIEVRSRARSARFSLIHARRQSRYAKEVIIPLAERVTHLTLLQHNAMSYGVFRLLQTKRIELEKKQEYLQFLQAFWINQIKLEALLQGRALDLPPQEAL